MYNTQCVKKNLFVFSIPNPQINQVFDTASQYISRKKDEYKKIKTQEEKPKQKKATKKTEKEPTDKKKSSFKIKFMSQRAKKRKALNESIESATSKKKKLCNCSKDAPVEDCLECITIDSKDSDFEEIIEHSEEVVINCDEKINELLQEEIIKITKPEQKRKPKCTKKIENDPVETESPQRRGVRVRKQTSFYNEQITKKSPRRRITPIKIGEVSTSKPCQGDFEGGYKTMQSPLPHMEEMLKNLEKERSSVDRPHETASSPVIPEINLDTKDVADLGSFERDILENMSEYLGDKSLPSLHSEGKTNESQKNVKDGENQLNFSDFLNKNTNTSTPIKKAELSSESGNTLTQSQASIPNVTTSPNVTKSYLLAPLKRDRRRRVIVRMVEIT